CRADRNRELPRPRGAVALSARATRVVRGRGRRVARRDPRRRAAAGLHAAARARLRVIGWSALGVIAAWGWFVTGARISYRLGLGQAAPVVVLMAAGVLLVTLCRWGV